MILKKYRKVAVGGTFDYFHKGHEVLLKRGVEVGEKLIIGICTDGFACKEKLHPIETFEKRKGNVMRFLDGIEFLNYEIIPIDDPYGPTLSNNSLDAIVVSRETKRRADEINALRVKRGLKPLDIVVVDMVLAEDGLPISSERIRTGDITRDGKLRRRGR